MNAKARTVLTQTLGALVLTGSFLGAFALLTRGDGAVAEARAEASGVTPAAAPPARPIADAPVRALGDVGGPKRIADVQDLMKALNANGDAPGPDSALGRPPRATRLFSGQLASDGTRMIVYETPASAKETQAWADAQAKALGLSAIVLPSEDGKRVPTAVRDDGEATPPSGLGLGLEEGAAEASATRKMYGGRDGKLVLGMRDLGDKRVVTFVAVGGEKLEPAKAPRAALD